MTATFTQPDLLDLIATDRVHRDDRAAVITAIRRAVTLHGPVISSNDWRPLLPAWVYHKTIGATVSHLRQAGALVPAGWAESDDHDGGNAGKPTRRWRVNVEALEGLT